MQSLFTESSNSELNSWSHTKYFWCSYLFLASSRMDQMKGWFLEELFCPLGDQQATLQSRKSTDVLKIWKGELQKCYTLLLMLSQCKNSDLYWRRNYANDFTRFLSRDLFYHPLIIVIYTCYKQQAITGCYLKESLVMYPNLTTRICTVVSYLNTDGLCAFFCTHFLLLLAPNTILVKHNRFPTANPDKSCYRVPRGWILVILHWIHILVVTKILQN